MVMVTVSGNPPLSSFLQWVQPVSTEERNQEYLQSCRNEMGRSWVIHHSLIDHTTTRIGPLQQGLRLPNIICPARIRGHIQLRQRDIYIYSYLVPSSWLRRSQPVQIEEGNSPIRPEAPELINTRSLDYSSDVIGILYSSCMWRIKWGLVLQKLYLFESWGWVQEMRDADELSSH